LSVSPASSQGRSRRAFIATLLTTLLVSILMLYLWQVLETNRQQHLSDRFQTDIGEVKTKISERMTAYGQVLKGGRSLFLSSQEVTRQEWHDYVSSLELDRDYPGIQGIGYAIAVSPAALAAHERQIRSEGFPDYHIWPEGKRDQYSAIIYLEPFDWRNQRAFGYDMFAQPTRHEAMERARDSGEASLTGKVLLVQETDKAPQAGTLLYVPLYRKGLPLNTVAERQQALIGWVYSPYRMDNLIEGIIGQGLAGMRVRIYDQDDSTPDNLLYDNMSELGEAGHPGKVVLHSSLSLTTAGRTWHLDFDALPAYAESIGFGSLALELSGMSVIGLLLIALVWNLFDTQRRVLILAGKLTMSLRESEERLKFALQGSGSGVWDWDLEAGQVYFSSNVTQMLGLERGALNDDPKAWQALLHPEDAEAALAALDSHLRGDSDEYVSEYRLHHRDGHLIWVQGHARVTSRNEDGSPRRLVGTMTDVTERRRDEEQIRLLSLSVDQAGEAIMMTDADGKLEYVNPAFCRITGFSAEEAVGSTPRILNSGTQDEAFYHTMWESIRGGRIWQGRLVDRRKDGSLYPAMLTISPILNAKGEVTHFVGIQQDLQEYEDMEARFHQAQKMEAIGTLVGGIAHDFNNTLAGITGNLYLAKQQAKEMPELVARLSSVENLAFGAARMIQQLLAFSRHERASMGAMSISSFLKETIKLQRVSLPENIELAIDIPAEPISVKGDINLLQQVMINLLNNARDAVADVAQPHIEIRLQPYAADKAFLAANPQLKAREFAHISVGDNGHGIRKENMSHIFEPFFTTKDPGKGTGLGLAMAYGAIQTHEGVLTVESKQGEGTTFHIYLPLLSMVEDEGAMEAGSLVLGQGETVLAVDDNEEVIVASREVLESLGYRVLIAHNGEEALGIYADSQAEIDLVILDVVMPKMGGRETLQALRGINPKVRAIFATGYDRANVLQDAQFADVPAINKPFNITELSRLLRQVLSS